MSVFVGCFIWVKHFSLMNSHCELSALGVEWLTELSVCLPQKLASNAQCHIKAG